MQWVSIVPSQRLLAPPPKPKSNRAKAEHATAANLLALSTGTPGAEPPPEIVAPLPPPSGPLTPWALPPPKRGRPRKDQVWQINGVWKGQQTVEGDKRPKGRAPNDKFGHPKQWNSTMSRWESPAEMQEAAATASMANTGAVSTHPVPTWAVVPAQAAPVHVQVIATEVLPVGGKRPRDGQESAAAPVAQLARCVAGEASAQTMAQPAPQVAAQVAAQITEDLANPIAIAAPSSDSGLYSFLTSYRLEAFTESLNRLGASIPADLRDVTEADLASMEMPVLAQRRFVRAVQELIPDAGLEV